MKAYVLLEFLVFIAVLNVIIFAILGTLKLQYPSLTHALHNSSESITLCNKIAEDCIFESPFQDAMPFFDTNSTTAP